MAWHRIGKSYYSDEDLQARQAHATGLIENLLIPGGATAYGVYWLHERMSAMPFFVEHTTLAKLIYICAGLTLFSLIFSFRRALYSLIGLTIGIAIACSLVWSIGRWLIS